MSEWLIPVAGGYVLLQISFVSWSRCAIATTAAPTVPCVSADAADRRHAASP
jgi:hypothetical protein